MHSPEPWTTSPADHTAILDGNGNLAFRIYPADDGLQQFPAEEVARLLAAVNCLAGIPACDLPRVRRLWDQHKVIEASQQEIVGAFAERYAEFLEEQPPGPQWAANEMTERLDREYGIKSGKEQP
jgi:hypothetical protein